MLHTLSPGRPWQALTHLHCKQSDCDCSGCTTHSQACLCHATVQSSCWMQDHFSLSRLTCADSFILLDCLLQVRVQGPDSLCYVAFSGVAACLVFAGGDAVASQSVFHELMRFRQAGKPVVACLRDDAASGAYQIAGISLLSHDSQMYIQPSHPPTHGHMNHACTITSQSCLGCTWFPLSSQTSAHPPRSESIHMSRGNC